MDFAKPLSLGFAGGFAEDKKLVDGRISYRILDESHIVQGFLSHWFPTLP
jgi:hypothetical protein